MVIGIQTCFFQALRLAFAQHSERAAYFHAHLIYALHHVEHFVEIAVVAHFAPGRAHAKARAASIFGALGVLQHFCYFHQFFYFHVGVITRRLRAIGTVFGATTRFDRQQRTNLHFLRVVVLAVNGGRAIYQI